MVMTDHHCSFKVFDLNMLVKCESRYPYSHAWAPLSCVVFKPQCINFKRTVTAVGALCGGLNLNSRKPNIMQIFTHKQGVNFFSCNLRTFYLGRGQRGVGCKHGKNMRLFVSKCLLFVCFNSFARFIMSDTTRTVHLEPKRWRKA